MKIVTFLALFLLSASAFADAQFCKRPIEVIEAVTLRIGGSCQDVQPEDLLKFDGITLDYTRGWDYGDQLTAGDLAGFDNLKYLNIFHVNSSNDSKPLKPLHLAPDLFQNHRDLRRLGLTGNIIIKPEIFVGQKSMTRLQIDSQQLTEITSYFFADMPSLEEIQIDDSALVKIDAYAFSGLPNLKLLLLTTNENGATIDETALSGLHNLQTLGTYGYADFRIKNAPPKLFSDLTNITELNFKSFGVLAPNTFASQTHLKRLTVFCTQKQYPPHLLLIPSLEALRLEGPGFFPDHFFADIPNLKYFTFYPNEEFWDFTNADLPNILFCIANDCAPSRKHLHRGDP